jgi:hypothetical protein
MLTKLLKTSTDFISVSLSYLCNQSLTKGIPPEQLKYSKVKPLYKKGEKILHLQQQAYFITDIISQNI